MEAFSPSEDQNSEAFNIVGAFAAHIYVLGETQTASEFAWFEAEAQSADRMADLAKSNPAALLASTPEGVTPLMLAAYHGHAHLVEVMLQDPAVRERADTTSALGATAADLAILAYKQSETHCRPLQKTTVSEEFIPSMVTASYYRSRNPYARIFTVFRRAGIHPDLARVQLLMRRFCPLQKPEAESARDLQRALLDLAAKPTAPPTLRLLRPETLLHWQLLNRMWESGALPVERVAACLLEIRILGHLRPETRCYPS